MPCCIYISQIRICNQETTAHGIIGVDEQRRSYTDLLANGIQFESSTPLANTSFSEWLVLGRYWMTV